MNTEYLIILSVLFTLLLLLVQRTESTKRRIVLFVMVIPAIVICYWVTSRDKETEALTALAIALLINFLFWVLIGRYNPVGSSDQIRVLSMDD